MKILSKPFTFIVRLLHFVRYGFTKSELHELDALSGMTQYQERMRDMLQGWLKMIQDQSNPVEYFLENLGGISSYLTDDVVIDNLDVHLRKLLLETLLPQVKKVTSELTFKCIIRFYDFESLYVGVSKEYIRSLHVLAPTFYFDPNELLKEEPDLLYCFAIDNGIPQKPSLLEKKQNLVEDMPFDIEYAANFIVRDIFVMWKDRTERRWEWDDEGDDNESESTNEKNQALGLHEHLLLC